MELFNFAPHVFWFAIAIVLIGYELIAGFNLLFLFFMGLSAVCVGFMTFYNFTDPNNIVAQLVIFLTLFATFFITFWKPVRKFMNSGNENKYQNIIGQKAEVVSTSISKGKVGKIKWSGTEVKAKIHDSSTKKILHKGEDVEIVEIIDNTFIVKSIN